LIGTGRGDRRRIGAAADSFNLTIQNLREIVQQVKLAALLVRSASDPHRERNVARGLSDALRQAEELAVTIHPVQMMTESINRVAKQCSVRRRHVAKQATATAQEGRRSGWNARWQGFFEIRGNRCKTTCGRRRLAERPRRFPRLQALISQIVNLLALERQSAAPQVKPDVGLLLWQMKSDSWLIGPPGIQKKSNRRAPAG
jgi:twitching motility protein PilJ